MWPWYRELAHRRRPDLHTRIGEFARRIVVKARAGDVDEILVVGHSAGGTILIPLLARALELDAHFADAGSSVTALALGSNLPLAALHPDGDDFRNAIRRVAVEPSLTWIDCQARKDVVNFQDCDMVAGLGVETGSEQRNPLYWNVRFRDVVSAQFYPRLRWNLFRMHYQFIMANDLRTPYDYFMFVCGPARLLDWARNGARTSARFTNNASYIFESIDPASRNVAAGCSEMAGGQS
jgi:pimeloyl-ACP methyl ester carboxylesterase